MTLRHRPTGARRVGSLSTELVTDDRYLTVVFKGGEHWEVRSGAVTVELGVTKR